MTTHNGRGELAPSRTEPRIRRSLEERVRQTSESRVQIRPAYDWELPRRGPSIARIRRVNEIPPIFSMGYPLNGENWTVWRERMMPVLELYGLKGYIEGRIERPDPTEDPTGAANWDSNDTLARCLVMHNIAGTEMLHIVGCTDSHEMWKKLKAAHTREGYRRLAVALTRNLTIAVAKVGDNICEHLDKLKRYQMRINLMAADDLRISDRDFKRMVAASLPQDWDQFAEPFVLGPMSSHQLIGVLKEEFLYRESRKREAKEQPSRENKRVRFATNQNGQPAN